MFLLRQTKQSFVGRDGLNNESCLLTDVKKFKKFKGVFAFSVFHLCREYKLI